MIMFGSLSIKDCSTKIIKSGENLCFVWQNWGYGPVKSLFLDLILILHRIQGILTNEDSCIGDPTPICINMAKIITDEFFSLAISSCQRNWRFFESKESSAKRKHTCPVRGRSRTSNNSNKNGVSNS